MRLTKSIAVLTSILAPSIGAAQFSYTAVELSFVDVEIDAPSVDGDGFEIAGSFEINDSFFALGAYQDQDFDFGIDGNSLQLGVGYHTELGDDLDFVGTASWVSAEVEAGGLSFDDDGLGIAGGIRAAVADGFQVDAMLNWVDLDDSGSDTWIALTGRYYFNEQIAGFVRLGVGQDDADTLQLGARFEF